MITGKRVGYSRVSSVDQNSDRQLENITLDKLFTDKASGQDTNRPQLQALLDYVREGDIVIVHSLDRLARNLDDIRHLIHYFTARQVTIQFLKEKLTFTGDDSPMANLMLSVMGAFAEFERSLIKERQKEGIALAKKRGAYNRGRKLSLSFDQIQEIKYRIAQGNKKSVVARDYGICRETLYQYLKK